MCGVVGACECSVAGSVGALFSGPRLVLVRVVLRGEGGPSSRGLFGFGALFSVPRRYYIYATLNSSPAPLA